MSCATRAWHMYLIGSKSQGHQPSFSQSMLRATPCRRGQTLIELLIVATIMIIFGALGVDLLRPSGEEKIQGAVRMFAQDIEYARGATLINPDDPASVWLAQDQRGWIVARNSTPTVAMVCSDGTSLSRVLGHGMFEAAQGVRLVSSNTSQRQVQFDPFGGVITSPASIDVFFADSNSKCTITFDSSTGAMLLNWSNP